MCVDQETLFDRDLRISLEAMVTFSKSSEDLNKISQKKSKCLSVKPNPPLRFQQCNLSIFIYLQHITAL